MFSPISWAMSGVAAFIPAVGAVVLDLPITENGHSVVHLGIGTPPKTFALEFDTGSATSWVTDGLCPEKACPNYSDFQRIGYFLHYSSTGNLTGEFDQIGYLGGLTAGNIVSDIFSLGNFSWRQSFMSAIRSDWADLAADGFMGLSFNSYLAGNASTILYSILPQLDRPRFGIYYNKPTCYRKLCPGGLLTLGDSREEKYAKGPLTRVPIIQAKGQWDVWRSKIQGMAISRDINQSSHKASSKHVSFDSGHVVFDTGAGGIALPQDKIDAVYESLGWNFTQLLHSERILNCTEFNSSWSVTFEFGLRAGEGSAKVTLAGDELATPGFANREDACWPPFEMLQYTGFTLIGKQLLEKFYTVWDFGSHEESKYAPTLSFGKLKA